jgi:hypothetical protein
MHRRQRPMMSAQWLLCVCRYDLLGSNFQVPLRMALTSLSMDDEDMPEGTLIPDSELPELPGELCGIWAYIQWEAAGCPNRSQHESDAEYQKAIAVSDSSVNPSRMFCSQGFD